MFLAMQILTHFAGMWYNCFVLEMFCMFSVSEPERGKQDRQADRATFLFGSFAPKRFGTDGGFFDERTCQTEFQEKERPQE